MTTKLTIALATAAIAGGGGAAASAATTATRHLEGRVTAIDRTARAITVRDHERGTLKVKVTAATRFEDVTFSRLRTGHRVEIRAKRVAGAWTATKVEREDADERDDHDAADDHGRDDR